MCGWALSLYPTSNQCYHSPDITTLLDCTFKYIYNICSACKYTYKYFVNSAQFSFLLSLSLSLSPCYLYPTLIYYIIMRYNEYDNKKFAIAISISICVVFSLYVFFSVLYNLFLICSNALYQVVNINIRKYSYKILHTETCCFRVHLQRLGRRNVDYKFAHPKVFVSRKYSAKSAVA